LQALGIKRGDYAFLPHVTISYVEKPPTPGSAVTLAQTIKDINRGFFATPLSVTVDAAELRLFDDMTAFRRGPIAATFTFG